MSSMTDFRPGPLAVSRWREDADGNRSSFPTVIQPDSPVSIMDAAEALTGWIESRLPHAGALLLRGFEIDGPETFRKLVQTLTGPPLDYDYGSTPRTEIGNKVYTSTEYPAHQTITLHNEMAYADAWPGYLYFYSRTVAEEGGQTPIADSREIYHRIPETVRKEFEERGLLYLRNYRPGMDVPWQQVFQTDSRQKAEAQCLQRGMTFEWIGDRHLRTWHRLNATAKHPVTGESVWFNQAHLFHESNLEPRVLEAMQSLYEAKDFPRNVFFGDGSPIPVNMLQKVRQAMEACKVTFDWAPDDILILDNMAACHGREPFHGDRKVFVAMTTTRRSKETGSEADSESGTL